MFTPRSVRMHQAHTVTVGSAAAVDPSASSSSLRSAAGAAATASTASLLVGGGVGLSGSTALSRHMLGSDSARGVGMGLASARSQGAKAGVAFRLQPGRARAGVPSSPADLFSVAPLASGVGAGSSSGALSARTRSHRAADSAAHRAQALASLGASTARWRFLKEGDASLGAEVERGFVHSLPLPASIPLTAEGRAYLAAYEAHQAKLAAENSLALSGGSGGQESQPTFRSLLAAQEAAERERSELERLRSEHSAWQRLHGLVSFDLFARWRRDAAVQGETVSAEQKLEEETRRTSMMQKQWEQGMQQQQREDASVLPSIAAASARSAAEEAAAAVSAGMKTNFMPALLASTLNASGAAAAADHSHTHTHSHSHTHHSHQHHTHHAHHHHSKHDGRAEFLAQLDQMEREDELKLQQQLQLQAESGAANDEEKSDSTIDATTAPHPHPPSQAKPPSAPRPRSSGRRSAGRVRSSGSGAIAEEKSAEEHVPTFGQSDLEASFGTAAAIEEASHNEQTSSAAAAAAAAAASAYPPPRSASSRGRSRVAPADDSGRAPAVVHFGENHAAAASATDAADAVAEAASASSSSSGSSSRSSSRDSSPVILWRQTNRVKEALDIPQELRSVFLAEPDEEQQEAEEGEDAEASLPGRMKSTAAYKPQPLSALDRIAAISASASARQLDPSASAASNALQELEYNLNPRMQAARQRAKAAKVRSHRARLLAAMANGALPSQPLTSAALRSSHHPPPVDSSFTYKLPRAQPPKRYGAWYLPTSLWIAEQKPVFKSPISSRVNILQPHMSLGSWNARTTSLHGAETLQLGQAEYEEVRRTTGMSGLLSWAELQEREAAASVGGLRGGFALGSSVARATLGGRSLVDDDSAEEEDDIDAASKINAIKAKALEARNRRRREAEAKKVAAYERARGRKQKAMRAKARASRGGPFSRVDGEDEGSDDAGAADDAASPSEPPSAGLIASGSSAVPAALLSADSSLEEKLASLKDALPQLEIAQAYKAYIQRQGAHARMPHFLRKVEMSPEALQSQRAEDGGSNQHHSHGAIVKAAAAAAAFAAAGAAHSAAAAAAASASASGSHTDRQSGSHHPSAPLPRHHSTSRSVASSGLSHRVDLSSEEHKQGSQTHRDYRFA